MNPPHSRLFVIGGMQGTESAPLLQRAVMAVSGVTAAEVDTSAGCLRVEGTFREEDVIRSVEAFGLSARPEGGPEGEPVSGGGRSRRLPGLVAGAAVVGLLTILPLPPPVVAGYLWIPVAAVVAVLALGLGWPVLRRARSAWCRSLDSLAVVSAGALWTLGLLGSAWPRWLPTEDAHGLLPFVLLILWSAAWRHEAERSRQGAGWRVVPRLEALRPGRALVLDDGTVTERAPDDLRAGDRVRVETGCRVPADGVVVGGNPVVEESLLAGDLMPVQKLVGDEVVGGSANRSDPFVLRVTGPASDSVLARLIATVREAQRSKPHPVRITDRVATAALSAAAVLAVVTALFWILSEPGAGAALPAAAALGILGLACPVALALAAPLAESIGLARSAEQGAVIRRGSALESIQSLTTVVLDKTGTVTRGEPDVVAVEPVDGVAVRDLFRWAASLEDGWGHGLAGAIVRAARERDIQPARVRDREPLPGGGIVATLGNRRVVLGSGATLEALDIDNPLAERAAELQDEASRPLFLAVDGSMAGLIALADSPREDAAAAVARLRALGLRVILLTGDDERTARAVAGEVGVSEVIADVLPTQKAGHIRALQARGERVGMVGDGNNDAPALIQAHVGFALAGGTEVALQSADVTLVRDSLHALADSVFVARATLANVRANLVAAFSYNVLALPVAAGMLYPAFGWLLDAVVLGVAVLLSTLTVVANAVRLRFQELVADE